MMSIMLTQSNIIIQRCKISKKPSAAVLLKCCWDSLLVLETREIGDTKADKSCQRVLAIKKCFATKPWLCQGTELLEIVSLCFVYKDH